MDKVIMNDSYMAITAHMNIQFNGINRQCEGVEKSSKCIFGSKLRTSPMCNSKDMLIHEMLCSSFFEDYSMCLVIMIIISFDVVCIVYFMTEKNPPQAAADLSHTVRLVSRAL